MHVGGYLAAVVAPAPRPMKVAYARVAVRAPQSEVLEEAWELVEHGLVGEDDFRQFVFANPVRLHTALNPDFFNGTVVEDTLAKI